MDRFHSSILKYCTSFINKSSSLDFSSDFDHELFTFQACLLRQESWHLQLSNISTHISVNRHFFGVKLWKGQNSDFINFVLIAVRNFAKPLLDESTLLPLLYSPDQPRKIMVNRDHSYLSQLHLVIYRTESNVISSSLYSLTNEAELRYSAIQIINIFTRIVRIDIPMSSVTSKL